jgi:hypothetical protein
MNLFRDIQKNEVSRFLIPALAVLFIFSLSIHNHGIGEYANFSIDSHSSSSHSVDDCSACLLQGNLQVPETGFAFNIGSFGLLTAYISNDFTVPHTFVDLNKPSRAPPTS